MKLLLDTQLLLWAAGRPERLSPHARKLRNSPENELLFSAASLWEIAIMSETSKRLVKIRTLGNAPRPPCAGRIFLSR